MKTLVKILLAGTALFMAVAMAQEWDVFASAWRGARPAVSTPVVPAARREAAEAAVQQLHVLSRHLYASGGDPRFAERLPVSEQVVQELLADVAYLQHHGLKQESSLVRLDVLEARPLGEEAVELLTKEYWIVRLFRVRDQAEVEPPRSQLLFYSYRVKLEGAAWRVQSWDIVDPPAGGG